MIDWPRGRAGCAGGHRVRWRLRRRAFRRSSRRLLAGRQIMPLLGRSRVAGRGWQRRRRWRRCAGGSSDGPSVARLTLANDRLGDRHIAGPIANRRADGGRAWRRRSPRDIADGRAAARIVARQLELHAPPSGVSGDLILDRQRVGLQERIDGQPMGHDLAVRRSRRLKLQPGRQRIDDHANVRAMSAFQA